MERLRGELLSVRSGMTALAQEQLAMLVDDDAILAETVSAHLLSTPREPPAVAAAVASAVEHGAGPPQAPTQTAVPPQPPAAPSVLSSADVRALQAAADCALAAAFEVQHATPTPQPTAAFEVQHSTPTPQPTAQPPHRRTATSPSACANANANANASASASAEVEALQVGMATYSALTSSDSQRLWSQLGARVSEACGSFWGGTCCALDPLISG